MLKSPVYVLTKVFAYTLLLGSLWSFVAWNSAETLGLAQSSPWAGCDQTTLWYTSSHSRNLRFSGNGQEQGGAPAENQGKRKWPKPDGLLKEQLLTLTSGEKIRHAVRVDPLCLAQIPGTAACGQKLSVSETQATFRAKKISVSAGCGSSLSACTGTNWL